MNILFHANQLGLRGTEIAIFDYARYNEEILGNRSLVTFNKASKGNDLSVIEKFKSRFEVVGYDDFAEVDRIAENMQAELFYIIKSGNRDGKILRACPNAVHAVFEHSPTERHGECYAYVSKWLADRCSGGALSYVPHIVDLPMVEGDMRSDLSIPAQSMVLGGYGGHDSFDVTFVKKALPIIMEKRRDLYVLFMNFEKFMEHDRVIFLPGSSDMKVKSAFINSCDAMLHARMDGETFGIACGEFSISNCPVITYRNSRNKAHIDILGDKGLYYGNAKELEDIIIGFDRDEVKKRAWDCYSQYYTPKPVMELFKSQFIEGEAGITPGKSGLGKLFDPLWWSYHGI